MATKKAQTSSKSSAKKAPAKNSAKKTSAKKAPAKKSPAKKTSSKKALAKSASKKSSAKKSGGLKYSPAASKNVEREMREMKEGKLTSGRSGKKVTNPNQAIAIGLSEARRAGKKVPPNPNR